MTIELSELAAGLPMAASFALAVGMTAVREDRRRTALNEAMHELRRPLQALSLALPPGSDSVDSTLRLTADALERLDRAINGGSLEPRPEPVAVRVLLEQALGRWETQAALAGVELRLDPGIGDTTVVGDPLALAQAVDNLINNAIEHGGRTVVVEAVREGRLLRISVRDSGGSSSRRVCGRRLPGPSRHGNGLRVVSRVARAHGGEFELRRSGHGTSASLRLPLGEAAETR
jgi:signal transduction histidine kinase